jgi:biopolymer transport protein ExbD
MSETKSNINVTPLIDILLVLLVIFMVISPLKSSAFKTKIPSEPIDNINVKANLDNLVVTINSTSSLTLNKDEKLGTVEEPSALIARLSEVFSQRDKNLNAEKTVFIKAPKTMNYGDIVKVVDAVKMSGASPLSLQIDDLER